MGAVPNIYHYKNLASTMAAVSAYMGSYSLIDRLANALSSDSVNKVIYEMSRILNSMSRNDEQCISQSKDEKNRPFITIKTGKESKRGYIIEGELASASLLEEFLAETEKSTIIARSLASYAMYLVAKAQTRSC